MNYRTYYLLRIQPPTQDERYSTMRAHEPIKFGCCLASLAAFLTIAQSPAAAQVPSAIDTSQTQIDASGDMSIYFSVEVQGWYGPEYYYLGSGWVPGTTIAEYNDWIVMTLAPIRFLATTRCTHRMKVKTISKFNMKHLWRSPPLPNARAVAIVPRRYRKRFITSITTATTSRCFTRMNR